MNLKKEQKKNPSKHELIYQTRNLNMYSNGFKKFYFQNYFYLIIHQPGA